MGGLWKFVAFISFQVITLLIRVTTKKVAMEMFEY